MIYGEKLKELREIKGITQNELANILGIARALYAQYETYDKVIPLYHLNTLSNYFNVSIDYLFGIANIKCYNLYNQTETIDKKLVGTNLKQFRKENKITLMKLANLLNTSHSTLSAYENGKTLILTSFLYNICREYNISADYLLGKIESPKYLTK